FRVARQALRAACRAGLALNPPPPGGGPLWVPGDPPRAAPDGGETPCCLRHLMNAERLGLLDPDPDVEALVVPPHAAMNPLAVMAVTANTMRRGRKLVGLGRVIWFLSWHAVRPPSPQGVRSTPEETESMVREVDRKWG